MQTAQKPPPSLALVLVNHVSAMVTCWKQAFQAFPEVRILHGDILAVAENALVSPANSYGFMDGGIDQHYLDFFGLDLQRTVQHAIARRCDGYLPVGDSLIVVTSHPRIPYLIVAPTMTIPEPVHPSHSYRALSAALRFAQQQRDRIQQVFCPGLGTGVGQVPYAAAAYEMAAAYRDWKAHEV